MYNFNKFPALATHIDTWVILLHFKHKWLGHWHKQVFSNSHGQFDHNIHKNPKKMSMEMLLKLG